MGKSGHSIQREVKNASSLWTPFTDGPYNIMLWVSHLFTVQVTFWFWIQQLILLQVTMATDKLCCEKCQNFGGTPTPTDLCYAPTLPMSDVWGSPDNLMLLVPLFQTTNYNIMQNLPCNTGSLTSTLPCWSEILQKQSRLGS